MASSAVQQVCQHTVFHVCQAKAPLGGKGAAAECRTACPRLQDWRRWGLDSGLAWNGIGSGSGSGSNGHSRQVVTARVGALFGVGPREEKPVAVELEPITGEEQFNALLAEAQAEGKRVVIEWMASWCRKCIYLKPKLERLAAEYHPNTRFFCIDVNAVPSTLVKRAEVTKMPTIQLWVDGEKKAEVIGGHKAWLVLDEIREMLQPDRV